jgi:restriction system protein
MPMSETDQEMHAGEAPVYILDDWRAVMMGKSPQPSDAYLVICFPCQEIAEQYLTRISEWPEEEIRSVLRSMLGGTRDVPLTDRLDLRITEGRRAAAVAAEPFTEHERRLILRYSGHSSAPVWEGLTWVIDALPGWPRKALDAVDAYLHATFSYLSDLRIDGIGDAMSIIRHRYILEGGAQADMKLRLIRDLRPRELEYLTAALFDGQGYNVEVTPEQKDGGKDIIAIRGSEKIFIECKNWGGKVTVVEVRAFTAVCDSEGVTRGIFVAPSGFTSKGSETAASWASQLGNRHRLVLLDGDGLIQQLNEYLGTNWHLRADGIIARYRGLPGRQ